MPREFTLEQTKEAFEEYMRDFPQLEAQCKASVADTGIANDSMICPIPLFDQIAKHAYYWTSLQRRWVASRDETTLTYEHRFDKHGVLRHYNGECLFYKDRRFPNLLDARARRILRYALPISTETLK
jgi:hypothetical protein